MTEAMPFLQKYDITFLRPPTILPWGCFHRVAFQLFLEIKHLCNIFQQGQRTLFRANPRFVPSY